MVFLYVWKTVIEFKFETCSGPEILSDLVSKGSWMKCDFVVFLFRSQWPISWRFGSSNWRARLTFIGEVPIGIPFKNNKNETIEKEMP